ncbi:MAG TPA: hypothetical protein VJ816_07020 [Gemmatimonadales bacterium]|nr:hypothetical protein [Gemmatimonadales bacterium]
MRSRALLGLVLLSVAAFGSRAFGQSPGFDHWKHRKVFPACQACHAGAVAPDRPLWPAIEACRNCHDGTVEKVIEWSPPTETATNLRFTHDTHARAFRTKVGADSTLACMNCHSEKDAPWMQVARPVPSRCLDCHGIKLAHHQAPDTACATCHLRLPEATGLTRERIARFPKPASHEAADFLTKTGHGGLAQPVSAGPRSFAVAPSCATCHARDFCLQCHVNAPEVPVIKALATDPRSTAIVAHLQPPANHKESGFWKTHGGESRRDPASCATCHTRESCATCHRGTGIVIAQGLPAAGRGRAIGAQVQQHLPDWHSRGFVARHGPSASADPNRCNVCHARPECLDCHRPNAGATGTYHAAGFLARHPAAAYGRQNDCSECHNPASFCANCHVQSGFRSHNGLLQGQYHDAGSAFLFSHGRAARFNLESCVTCHSEKDCTACHSAQTRHFNPHGPGFDAERLKRKNPETCSACHGRAIP